jgi:hypothetical protein
LPGVVVELAEVSVDVAPEARSPVKGVDHERGEDRDSGGSEIGPSVTSEEGRAQEQDDDRGPYPAQIATRVALRGRPLRSGVRQRRTWWA